MTTQSQPTVTEAGAYEVLRRAQMAAEIAEQKKSRMWDSAVLAASDAAACFNRGDFRYARERALESLAYSVGKFSEAYRSACSFS